MESNQQQDQSPNRTKSSSSRKWIYVTILLLILLIVLLFLITRSCGNPKDPDTSGDSSSPAASVALTSSPASGSVSSAQTAVGSVIQMGKYEQDNDLNNGKEPIDWVVLAVEDGRMLLTSVYVLEMMPYNDTNVRSTWESATLRTWLNEDFYGNSFNNEEKEAIQITQVDNNDSVATYGVNPGGNNTLDQVFLLSVYEARKYIPGDAALSTPVTAYLSAKAQGRIIFYEDEDKGECGWWWSRSLGSGAFAPGEYHASVFSSAGSSARQIDAANICVRPAIWIRSGS